MKTLKHITDVGSSEGNGVDSTTRIEKQYERLGMVSHVISAGHSPLNVAFAGCTDLSENAKKNTKKILKTLNIKEILPVPVALNSAPRNKKGSQDDGKEDYIYRVQLKNKEVFLIYGPEVLRWVLEFHNENDIEKVEKIISINNLIPDTSKGSQFRSAEHLPIAHFLESKNILDNYSEREKLDISKIEKMFSDKKNVLVVAPPDEYGNGRLILDKKLLEKILKKKKIIIPEITNKEFAVKKSLTEIEPNELSVWVSSNHFPNENLKVLNIGTRWKENTTRTTNLEVVELIKQLALNVGKKYKISI